ncbi:MAG: extracellular solute-binding protein [Pseudomonadota bacterium]
MKDHWNHSTLGRSLVGFVLTLILLTGLLAPDATEAQVDGGVVSHGIAMQGMPKYGPDFEHLDYANPTAPVGGELRQAVVGSFDSLNPFIILGRTAAGARPYLFPQLMARTWDEPFSLYGYVAETIEVPEDRSWAIFQLNPDAVWDDGTPITVGDVIFTIETLREQGLPGFRRAYAQIAHVAQISEHGVRFDFNEEADRETVMLIAQMPIISEAYYTANTFDAISLDPPLGAGPYRIGSIDPGRSIVYERVADWWGADLPVMRGQYNFDHIRYDYYRDSSIALEAFLANEYNLRREFNAETWATGYQSFASAQDGRATLATLPQGRPSGMRALVFNTRRDIFADPLVRAALIQMFDFEWVNRNLLFDQYERITGLFTNSFLAPEGLPTPAELALLGPYRDNLPEAVFGEPYQPPETDGSGNIRANLRAATALLTEAGFEVRNGAMVNAETGEPFEFEILLRNASDERIALAYADNLRRLGITANVRTVDSAQYTERTETYDYDMILHYWITTLSPGAEQYLYWGSDNVEIPGTRNYAGVNEPAVDAMVTSLQNARTRAELTAAARALDRVLMAGNYFIPLYYLNVDYWAWWGDFGRVTAFDPIYGSVLEAWWLEP